MSEEETKGLAEMEKIDFDNEYYYEINAKLMDEFMRSNYYKRCCDRACLFKNDTTFVKQIIDTMYTDPDTKGDQKLYNSMLDFYKKNNKVKSKEVSMNFKNLQYSNKCFIAESSGLRYGLDGVVSWEQIYDAYNKNGKNKSWIEKYKKIRGSVYGQVLWPRHKNSINQLRASVLNDRIDYTLFDIKQFFKLKENEDDEALKEKLKNIIEYLDKDCDINEGGKSNYVCRLAKAYYKEKTLAWLLSFDTFEDFIDTMKLNIFVVNDKQKNEDEKIMKLLICRHQKFILLN